MNLNELKTECENCNACGLCNTRNNVVFGAGDEYAKIMFVGEAPGANEDKKGEPFIGAGGKILDKHLAEIGLSRQSVYIANIVKCRPPNNRDPKPEEQNVCIHFLQSQIEIIKPKIIVCLGLVAAKRLISSDFTVSAQHGQWTKRDGIFVTGTFHPLAIWRKASNKQATKEDFIAIKAKLDELC